MGLDSKYCSRLEQIQKLLELGVHVEISLKFINEEKVIKLILKVLKEKRLNAVIDTVNDNIISWLTWFIRNDGIVF